MLHTIGLFLGVIFTIFAFIRIGYAVGEADFYISTRDNPNIQKLAKAKMAAKAAKKAAKAKPKAAKKDTTPSIVKLRRKQAEILQKTQARAIAERNAELALNLEYRKMVWAEKQANLQAALAKR